MARRRYSLEDPWMTARRRSRPPDRSRGLSGYRVGQPTFLGSDIRFRPVRVCSNERMDGATECDLPRRTSDPPADSRDDGGRLCRGRRSHCAVSHDRATLGRLGPAVAAGAARPRRGRGAGEQGCAGRLRSGPYLRSLATGASLTDMHAETHPSQPNYLALFSGDTHGVRDDRCPLTLGGRASPVSYRAPDSASPATRKIFRIRASPAAGRGLRAEAQPVDGFQ